MKMSVFVRILTATLFPVLLVLLIVIGTARTVIQADSIAYAKEFTMFAATQISEQTAAKLENTAIQQDRITREIAALDFTENGAVRQADALLNALMLSNRELYSVWFAFEPGVFGDSRYFKTLLRTEEGSVEIDDISDALLNNPSASPWYNVPLASGKVYADVSDYYDFGTGEGAIHTFTMTYPVISPEGEVLGCVGLDIRYEDLFSLSYLADKDIYRIMLASERGEILYSSIPGDTGGSLWDMGYENPGAAISSLNENIVWQEEISHPATGEKLLSCLFPIDIYHTGQTLYLCRDAASASLYSAFYSSMEIIIAAGVLGMVLLTFSVFYSTRGIVRHVKRITDSFNHVANSSAEGTLDGDKIPISETRVIELDILQSALVSMMIMLRRAHEHRVKAVEAEVEKEKLIASAEAKTNFFAAMSHEIRTPMNAIIGISEIMLHSGGLGAAQEKNIRDIKIAADSLLRIINDILDISKLETGKMELHPEHYNFKALIDNIVSLSAHLAAGAGIKFVFDPQGELPTCLYGDSARLRQVLLNLIGNAVKYTKEGYVKLLVAPRRDTIRFSVIDTGVGIKAEELGSVFESFKQFDTRRNRDVEGAGLGLSISKNLVDLMDGEITVKSIYGEGCTFSVTIPLVPGDESRLRHVQPLADTAYSPALRVLVVDDDKTNLYVSSSLLKTVYGIECDTAGSGLEAIDMVQNADYDMIFMDYMMPELNGLDTTRRIRNLGEKYRDIPIIALTANAVIGTKNELIGGGMDDFLTKPIMSERLHEILQLWVPDNKRMPAKRTVMPRSATLSALPGGMLEGFGIDTQSGMENIGNDEKMYLQSLRLLMERLPLTVPTLNALAGRQNLNEFQIQIHGLKGSLSSVGAFELSNDAKKIETAATAGDANTCRELLRPLTEKLLALHDSLREALPDALMLENDGVFSERLLKSGLERLLASLKSYDYETIAGELDSIVRIAGTSPASEMIARVKQLTDSFDYSAAAEETEKALAALGG